jgi:hypothetical protein
VVRLEEVRYVEVDGVSSARLEMGLVAVGGSDELVALSSVRLTISTSAGGGSFVRRFFALFSLRLWPSSESAFHLETEGWEPVNMRISRDQRR